MTLRPGPQHDPDPPTGPDLVAPDVLVAPDDPGAPGAPGAASAALRHLDQLANAVENLTRETALDEEPAGTPLSAPDEAGGSAFHELRLLEQVIDNFSVHTENDELLADAMSEVAALVGSDAVWVVEAAPDAALGVVHVMGELIIGESELPRDVARLCETLYDRRRDAVEKLEHRLPDGRLRVAMPLRVKQTWFGAMVFTTAASPPVDLGVRDRLLSSILRFLAISIENRHFVDSLTDMIIETVCGFSLAIESRDAYTGGHVMRVTAYALELAQKLGLGEDELAVLRLGGLLHDIGKVAIPDDILNKSDRLTAIERDVMQAHPSVGHAILGRIPHLDRANEIVRSHHERWDGRGYPDRLAGTDTPFLARILAIADAFDAMTSDRPYRQCLSFEAAMAEIRSCAGRQFDPDLAGVFLTLTDQELAAAEARMQRWMHSRNHGAGLSLGQLVAMKKPSI